MFAQLAKLMLVLTVSCNLYADQKVDSKTAVMAVMEKYLFTGPGQMKDLRDFFTSEYIEQMGGVVQLQEMMNSKKLYKKEDLKLEYIPSVTGDLYLVKVQDSQKHSFLYRVRYSKGRYLIDGGQEDTR